MSLEGPAEAVSALNKAEKTIFWDSWTDLLLWGQEELAALGPRESQTSAEYLLEEVSGMKPWRMKLESHLKPNETQAFRYQAMIGERKTRRPAAYVTGKAYFRNECFEVNSACLVPRPETELLVEAVIQTTAYGSAHEFEFLDLGTGSGAIAISLLRFFTKAKAVIADVSGGALQLACRNAESYDLSGRVQAVESDFFSAFREAKTKKKWPVIVSNPPYLAERDWLDAEPEILHEPRLALDGGPDGLKAYRQIAKEAGEFLSDGGLLFFEVGQGQAEAVKAILIHQGFTQKKVLKDFAGIDRIVIVSKGSHG